MPKRSLFMTLFLCLSLLVPLSFAGSYPGFKELKSKNCTALDSQSIQKLPSSWEKYEQFIKICSLLKSSHSSAKVAIVSIWTDDYMNSQSKRMWEDFPLTILVDENLNEIGTLPEIFPMDSRTEPIIYYGRWKSGIPTEIKVDVYNPTVSGDYYYAPLTWDEKRRRYHMIDKEPKFGPRPKH